jgi:hypothetical protein
MKVEEYEEPPRDMLATAGLASHLRFSSLGKNEDASVDAGVGLTAPNQESEKPNKGALSPNSNPVEALGEDL